ncbi:MAG: response regulator transcription factor [Duncaniella sp.]|nr:response regulator transcription factor [Duncaniella sp.]
MSIRLLVIDDEESICEILKYNLRKEGYEVDTAYSAEEALEKDLTPYDLFIVDIMMERLSGFDFAKALRNSAQTEDVPIIFCSALNGEDDTVMGLNIGADDYITKPFKVSEMIARVNAVLRRVQLARRRQAMTAGASASKQAAAQPQQVAAAPSAPDLEPEIVFETLRLDPNDKTIYIDDEKVSLTKTEYDLLYFFLTHRNRVYSRQEIIRNVWADDVVITNRTIDTNITRLRKKIGAYGNNIETRPGFGYGFK